MRRWRRPPHGYVRFVQFWDRCTSTVSFPGAYSRAPQIGAMPRAAAAGKCFHPITGPCGVEAPEHGDRNHLDGFKRQLGSRTRVIELLFSLPVPPLRAERLNGEVIVCGFEQKRSSTGEMGKAAVQPRGQREVGGTYNRVRESSLQRRGSKQSSRGKSCSAAPVGYHSRGAAVGKRKFYSVENDMRAVCSGKEESRSLDENKSKEEQSFRGNGLTPRRHPAPRAVSRS